MHINPNVEFMFSDDKFILEFIFSFTKKISPETEIFQGMFDTIVNSVSIIPHSPRLSNSLLNSQTPVPLRMLPLQTRLHPHLKSHGTLPPRACTKALSCLTAWTLWTSFSPIVPLPGDARDYVVTGLTSDTAYQVRLRGGLRHCKK